MDLGLERRARLALKGERLYLKDCGTSGPGLCAENFAVHQLTIGNVGVVVDYLDFLEGRLAEFSPDDSNPRKAMTADLIARIRSRLRSARA